MSEIAKDGGAGCSSIGAGLAVAVPENSAWVSRTVSIEGSVEAAAGGGGVDADARLFDEDEGGIPTESSSSRADMLDPRSKSSFCGSLFVPFALM